MKASIMSSTEIAALTKLFSSSVLKEIAKKGKSPLFARLARASKVVLGKSEDEPISNIFEAAFSKLREIGLRDEYVYKAAITHKVLLGTHSLRSASMLTEFRTDKCKADVVILNGSSTVYEIKSERDKLDRLPAQIAAYRRVFANINVITGLNHLDAVLALVPNEVGVLTLSPRYRISTVREAIESTALIQPQSIFSSLRRDEAAKILSSEGLMVPNIPNTKLHRAMMDEFNKLTPDQAHAAMVQTLKTTRSLFPLRDLLEQVPQSLRPAILCTPLRKQDHRRLVNTLKTPMHEAFSWSTGS